MLSMRLSELRTPHAVKSKSFVTSFILQMQPVQTNSTSQWPGRKRDQQAWEAFQSPGWMQMLIVQELWSQPQLPQQARQSNWFTGLTCGFLQNRLYSWNASTIYLSHTGPWDHHSPSLSLSLTLSLSFYISLHGYLHAYFHVYVMTSFVAGNEGKGCVCQACGVCVGQMRQSAGVDCRLAEELYRLPYGQKVSRFKSIDLPCNSFFFINHHLSFALSQPVKLKCSLQGHPAAELWPPNLGHAVQLAGRTCSQGWEGWSQSTVAKQHEEDLNIENQILWNNLVNQMVHSSCAKTCVQGGQPKRRRPWNFPPLSASLEYIQLGLHWSTMCIL